MSCKSRNRAALCLYITYIFNRSWYKWNDDLEKFDHAGTEMKQEHNHGTAVAIPRTAEFISSCFDD